MASCSGSTCPTPPKEGKTKRTTEAYWTRFQELKKRRKSQEVIKRASKKMKLKTVKKSETLDSATEEIKSGEITWSDIKPHIKTSSQLLGGSDIVEGRNETGLERLLDSALDKRDYAGAVELSDKISKRKFSHQIVTAVDSCKGEERRKKENEEKQQKRHKLKWKYEHKQRWEMKSNM
ncbi:PREDICTED: protein FAM204A-like [Amphimedon queenslandica]|uniref:Uncharacterized protein n=1 Tax=Amphimedon queenslandica TaxID=400682 RepID=A0A1X7VLQ0_AMPQE|nr:PREDICTED: protein FAM204A-like [Amphimedon queenslandica]|eukprot:XP_011409988.1 PREDICTED: protein FAM204A-like [Amphimedon queenslandica]